jgi:hypothetical protein
MNRFPVTIQDFYERNKEEAGQINAATRVVIFGRI